MGDNLSSDLASAIDFLAGGLVSGVLAIKAPEEATYYVLIEQYTAALAFLPGTRSYLYQPNGGTGVNDPTNFTIYELEEDEEKAINFNLALTYTDCYLYLFLKKMAGVVPAPDTDDTVDHVVVALNAPAAEAGLDLSLIMSMMVVVMMMGVMMKAMK